MQRRSGASADQGRGGAQKTGPEGTRVLRDQIYPVKVDNASRAAVLDQEGEVLLVAAAAEVLEKKMMSILSEVWLSRIDSGGNYIRQWLSRQGAVKQHSDSVSEMTTDRKHSLRL
jgi:hypothetical protein